MTEIGFKTFATFASLAVKNIETKTQGIFVETPITNIRILILEIARRLFRKPEKKYEICK